LINHQHYQLTTKPYNTIIAVAKHHCIKNFGFVSDPSKKLWENIPSALKALPTRFVLQSPANQYCHNLCTETAPPPGYNYLLGLGLNYCIESLHPNPNINLTVKKIEKSIRLKHWLSKNGIENNDDYIPSLYVPTTWKPPEASHEIKEAIQTFTTNLNKMVENNKTHPRANLTKLQHYFLHSIKNNNKLIICLSDKKPRTRYYGKRNLPEKMPDRTPAMPTYLRTSHRRRSPTKAMGYTLQTQPNTTKLPKEPHRRRKHILPKSRQIRMQNPTILPHYKNTQNANKNQTNCELC
jgi:hypothetical protein